MTKAHKHKKEHSEKKEHKDTKGKKTFLQSKAFLIILFILFSILYLVIFNISKDAMQKNYDAANQKVLAIKNFGGASVADITKYSLQFGPYIGFIFGIIALIVMLILSFITGIIKLNKFKATNIIVALVTFILLLWLGTQLAFFEKGNIAIANAIIYYIGVPLFYTALTTTILLAITLGIILSMPKKGEKNEE